MMEATPPPIFTVPFADKPCVVHTHHSPTPLLSQEHHVFPIELQALVWPGVTRADLNSLKAPHTIPVCGTGHDSIHVILRELVKTNGNAKIAVAHAKEWQYAIDGYAQYKGALADPTHWSPP